MVNNWTSSILYSCFDGNLSSTGVTPERWTSTTEFRNSIASAISLLIFFILGVSLNVLIVTAILWKKMYKQPAHIILLALVLVELFVCFTFYPMSIVSEFQSEFIFGSNDVTRCHFCQVGVTSVIALHLNIFLVALLSLDRFLFVRFPLHYSEFVTVKMVLVTVIIIFIFCIAFSIPPVFGFGEIRFSNSISTCTLYLYGRATTTENYVYVVFSLLVCFSGPGLTLLVTNTWLGCIVYKHLRKKHHMGKTEGHSGNVSDGKTLESKGAKQFPVIKLFGGLLVLNVIVWIPIIINAGSIIIAGPAGDASSQSNHSIVPHELHITCFLIVCSSVFLIPLLQLYLIPDIRQFISNTISKKLGRRQDLVATSSN